MNRTQPLLPEQVRTHVLDYMRAYAGGFEITPRARGFIVGFINAHLLSNGVDSRLVDAWRYEILSYLFAESLGMQEVQSSAQLGESQLYALYEWARPFKNTDDGLWMSGNGDFENELMVLYGHAKQQYDSQMEALGYNEFGA